MSLLQDLIKENAAVGATSAHAIGGNPNSLFGGGVITPQKRISKVNRMLPKSVKNSKNRNSWKWRIIDEMIEDEKFDIADVDSKLKTAEKRSKMGEDSVPFGLEDEEGQIVKVYVRAEQADEFESALASLLAGKDEDDDEDNSAIEIAEVLFQLKDQFDIIDVEWPTIEGDEEEEQELGGKPGPEGGFDDEGMPDEEMGEGPEGEDMGMEPEGEDMEMEPEGGAESALQQVIDMMKADAEARKAESEARAEEARARAAEAHATSAANKVKQEEEVLDMESYNKQKKEEEEEAKRLAGLAKWKHQQAADAEMKLSQEEEERIAENPFGLKRDLNTITKDELMRKIFDYLRAN